MDGWAVADRLKADARTRDIPVHVISIRDQPSPEHRRHGVASYTPKPADTDALAQVFTKISSSMARPPPGMLLANGEGDTPELRQAEIEANLAGSKALIVDDDVRNLFALTGLLENCGMTVVTAESGEEAIACLDDAASIDIVLMDIMMPQMDGYETMRRIRDNPRFRDLPIIALTAKAMKGDQEKCLQAGASAYASKPVDSEELLNQLRALLRHGGPARVDSGAAQPPI